LISREEFEKSEDTGNYSIADRIVKILKDNEGKAFGAKELEVILDISRQSVNQTIRSMAAKGLIVRKMYCVDNKRLPHNYIMLKENYNEPAVRDESEESEEPARENKPVKKPRGKGRKKSGKKGGRRKKSN